MRSYRALGFRFIETRRAKGIKASLDTLSAYRERMLTAIRIMTRSPAINPLINGVEAMAPITDRPREIVIRSEQDEGGQVHVSVRLVARVYRERR